MCVFYLNFYPLISSSYIHHILLSIIFIIIFIIDYYYYYTREEEGGRSLFSRCLFVGKAYEKKYIFYYSTTAFTNTDEPLQIEK